jgi:hypothetical protein
MGMPQGDDIVQVTNPYYRTAYTLVFRPGRGLDGVDTLTDPRLKDKRIGVVAGTPPATNLVLAACAKAKSYLLVVDTRYEMSADSMVHDIVDDYRCQCCGVRWPAITLNSPEPLTVVPLLKRVNGPRRYIAGMRALFDQNCASPSDDWRLKQARSPAIL